jgi:DNA topoisomerase VI subunit B
MSTKKTTSTPNTLDLFGPRAAAPASSDGAGAAPPAAPKTAPRPAPEKPAVETPALLAVEPEPARRRTAQEMGSRQREISVSEFFAKNRHLLGFDNPAKAILTTVKEAVDNSLDACEEAGILPEVVVELHETGENRFRVVIEDNGPGIVAKQVPNIFGKLLYGSKFHTRKQSRGQQGIGISAAGMYGLLTTGKPVVIVSRTGARKAPMRFELVIDTARNEPKYKSAELADWHRDHGTRVEIELEGIYVRSKVAREIAEQAPTPAQATLTETATAATAAVATTFDKKGPQLLASTKRAKQSVDGYLEQTAVANPHATIIFRPGNDPEVRYDRSISKLPPEPQEIKPHPHGVELGVLVKMMQETPAKTMAGFLQGDFSRVTLKVCEEILAKAKLDGESGPRRLGLQSAEALHKAINDTKIMAPPTNCLSPIGAEYIEASLKSQIRAEFFASVTRPPVVYRGNPFQVEVGLAYGGELLGDEPVTLLRFANRVPLLYQDGACAVSKTVSSMSWRAYSLSHPKGALPVGPMVLMVHIASVWVPFTSEAKEAIAHYPEIMKEIRLAVGDCGRKMARYINRLKGQSDELSKRSRIEKYIPTIVEALTEMLAFDDPKQQALTASLHTILEKSRSKGVELVQAKKALDAEVRSERARARREEAQDEDAAAYD